jgi:hypothetical protein
MSTKIIAHNYVFCYQYTKIRIHELKFFHRIKNKINL